MKHSRLQRIIFLALCCDLGLFSKRLIAPAANIITDFLRIPGGIGTSFSLMFLIIAAQLMPGFGCATLMSAVQSLLALSLGMVGSMGALSPVGYIVPGLVIDTVLFAVRKTGASREAGSIAANMLSAAAAGLTANMIVFHLHGSVLFLYILVALLSGAICGRLGYTLTVRLRLVISGELRRQAAEVRSIAAVREIREI